MSNFYICWKPGLSSYDQHGNFQLFVAPAFSSRLNWHLDIWTCKQNIRAHKNKSWKLKIQLYLFSLNFSRNNTKKRKKMNPCYSFLLKWKNIYISCYHSTWHTWNNEICEIEKSPIILFWFGFICLFVCFSQRHPNKVMLWDFLGKCGQMSFHLKQGTNKTPKK